MRAGRRVALTGLGLLGVGGLVAGSVAAAAALTGGVAQETVHAPVLVRVPVAEEPRQHDAGSSVDPRWVAATARATGVPPVALRGYATATLRLGEESPRCGLGWTTLAAIGAVESGHGTHGGTTLMADGRPRNPIIGPALDGSPGVAAIAADAASTARHGDLRWDRAVGPLQFIGSTWQRWQADGDGDGVADPQDIDDAALAAGRYLCAAGGDLRTGPGWTRAVHAYNHSDDYVAAVLATASGYVR